MSPLTTNTTITPSGTPVQSPAQRGEGSASTDSLTILADRIARLITELRQDLTDWQAVRAALL